LESILKQQFNVGAAGDLVHERAWAHTKQHGCGFHEAVRAVLAESDDELAAAYEVDRQRVLGQQAPQPKITPDMFATSKRVPEGFHTETFEKWAHSRGGGRTLFDQLTPEDRAALKPAGKK
jgi:hypothetical protein